jgi:hypothetical protein
MYLEKYWCRVEWYRLLPVKISLSLSLSLYHYLSIYLSNYLSFLVALTLGHRTFVKPFVSLQFLKHIYIASYLFLHPLIQPFIFCRFQPENKKGETCRYVKIV